MALAGTLESEFRKDDGTFDYTVSGAHSIGDVLKVAGLVVIAETASTTSGDIITVRYRGIVEMKCNSGDVIAVGENLNWDISANELVNAGGAGTGDPVAGASVTAAGSGVTVVQIALNQPIAVLAS